MLRPLLTLCSPGGQRGRLSVLIFHRVLAKPDPLFPDEMDAARFDAVCRWVRHWFNVLPLDEASVRLREGRLPARAACITFDDGYADNLLIATPILKRHGLNASFFIASGFLDGGRMWNDTVIEAVRACRQPVLDLVPLGLGQHVLDSVPQRREAIDAVLGQIKYLPQSERLDKVNALAAKAQVELPTDLMMSSEQLRELRRSGMLVGAHTVNHPILARVPLEVAREEIVEGRRAVEQIIGERVSLFAYPNGRPGQDYGPEHVSLVRELGFDAAVSTHWGAANAQTDLFEIPRFTPWDRSRIPFGLRMLRNLAS